MLAPLDFKRGMRRLAGAVCLITTRDDGEACGMVATSVTSLSADPPAVLVCVSKESQSHDRFVRSGMFCVNVLRRDDEELARRFAHPDSRAARFLGREWSPMTTGAPALYGALANFDCRLVSRFEHGSHSILVGELIEIHLQGDEIIPLVYLNGVYTTCDLQNATR